MRNLLQAAAIASIAFSLSAQTDRVPAGTQIAVRTVDAIDAKHPSDSRIYRGTVAEDVRDRAGRVVIERGAEAELIMRNTGENEVLVDLEALEVNGRRYSVDSTPHSVVGERDEREGVGKNERTGKYVGGGAVVGALIGAIAGGGKGAAIGAATGAGAGAVTQTVTRGGSVRLPSESVLTFRLERPLVVSSTHSGYDRDGYHYHGEDRGGVRSRSVP